MNFKENLDDALQLANNISNWDEDNFSWEKAYIAATFAAVSYEEIPEFELEKSKRAKLIPCERYQYHASRWKTEKRVTTVRALEIEIPIEIVVRNKVIVAISKTRKAIFVSFRGTTISFSDFKADLDIRKIRYPFEKSAKLHRGFFDAVFECFNEVIEKIIAFQEEDSSPIYVTGHSLGGAMAAIFYAHLNKIRFGHYKKHQWHHFMHQITSCYTFGMPRYGDTGAIICLSEPYHIFNEFDAIPTLPPRIFGFADSQDERCLNARSKVEPILSKGDCALRPGKGIATVLGISDHRMERYVERTKTRQLNGP